MINIGSHLADITIRKSPIENHDLSYILVFPYFGCLCIKIVQARLPRCRLWDLDFCQNFLGIVS